MRYLTKGKTSAQPYVDIRRYAAKIPKANSDSFGITLPLMSLILAGFSITVSGLCFLIKGWPLRGMWARGMVSKLIYIYLYSKTRCTYCFIISPHLWFCYEMRVSLLPSLSKLPIIGLNYRSAHIFPGEGILIYHSQEWMALVSKLIHVAEDNSAIKFS